jgi:hypothetical protein
MQTGWALGLLLAASTGWAQQAAPRPAAADEGGVHRMVIYNGAVRSIHYVYDGVSPSEASSLRDLERAENDVALADQLQALKLQYIRDERELESRRRDVQRLLYGYSSETTASASAGVAGYPGYGYGYGYPGYFGLSPYSTLYGGSYATAGYTGTAMNSLAFGVGDEGVLKTELAKAIAAQATPEYAAHASANLSASLARASQFEGTQKALGAKGPIAFAAGAAGPESRFGLKPGDDVNVTVRVGDKTEQVKGKVHSEGPEWLTVDTDAGQETIRTSEIMRVVKPKK